METEETRPLDSTVLARASSRGSDRRGTTLLVVVLIVLGLSFVGVGLVPALRSSPNGGVSVARSSTQDAGRAARLAVFSSKAQAMCNTMFKMLDVLFTPDSLLAIERDASLRGDAYGWLSMELRSLTPPVLDSAAVDGWIFAIEDAIKITRRAAIAAGEQDLDAYVMAVDDLGRQLEDARARGHVLGVDCP